MSGFLRQLREVIVVGVLTVLRETLLEYAMALAGLVRKTDLVKAITLSRTAYDSGHRS